MQHITPAASRFVVFTWTIRPVHSPVIEWFPALTERVSLTTVQGHEWLGGEANFTPVLKFSEALQVCLYQDVTCVETLTDARWQSFDYIWLSRGNPTRESALSVSLKTAPGYTRVFANDEVQIYQRGPSRARLP